MVRRMLGMTGNYAPAPPSKETPMTDDLVVLRAQLAASEAALTQMTRFRDAAHSDVGDLQTQVVRAKEALRVSEAALKDVAVQLAHAVEMLERIERQAAVGLGTLKALAAPAKEPDDCEAPQPRYTSLDDGRRTPFEPYADSPRAEKEGE